MIRVLDVELASNILVMRPVKETDFWAIGSRTLHLKGMRRGKLLCIIHSDHKEIPSQWADAAEDFFLLSNVCVLAHTQGKC